MANFSAHGPSGRALPNNWQSLAKSNAAQANADYQHRLENAWRGNRDNETLIQSARLTNHPQPAPPKRNDARSDARFDGMMQLVKDDELEQVWKDNTGRLVTIKKRK
jgi:hypothetical protein